MPRPFGSPIVLTPAARHHLETLVRAGSTPQALAFRCRLILRAAADDHPTNQAVAAALGCDRHTVGQWRERFAARGLAGLQDAPRPGRPRGFSPRRTAPGRHPRHHQGRGA
jgi:Winged helix-turn helix